MPSEEQARRVVEAYAKGIICSGEVFNQFVNEISEDSLESYMALLSQELITRFRQNLHADVDRPFASADDLARWRRGEELIEGWLRQREPEQTAAPNGGPATHIGNSGVTEGPPSVS